MVKYVCLKFWAFVLGLLAMPINSDKAYASNLSPSESIESLKNNSDKIFIEPYLDDSASFKIAGHRSHRSHSSHRSHYSSRGGYSKSYYRSPSYSTPSSKANLSSSYSKPYQSGGSSSYTKPSNSEKLSNTPSNNAIKAPVASEMKKDSLVLEIQTKLKKLGFYDDVIDGIYGEKTRLAIILYQTSEGIEPDGKATQDLLKQINNNYF